MKLAVTVLLFIALLQKGQGGIDFIQDRPLTWDWQGTVPLYKGDPGPQLAPYLTQMRAGDYFQAYLSAKKDLADHSDHFIDTWVMAESARKRKTIDEILRDSDAMLTHSRNPGTLILRVRALGLQYAKALQDEDMKLAGKVYKDEETLLTELRPFAAKDLAALILEMSYGRGAVMEIRTAAKGYAAQHPADIEIQLLVVRSLLRGDYGYGGSGGWGKSGKVVVGQDGPDHYGALTELDRIEKKLGSHPLVTYYRTVAHAMKVEVGNPRKVDFDAVTDQAIKFAKQFIRDGTAYPRLVPLCQAFLARPRVGCFFPVKDE